MTRLPREPESAPLSAQAIGQGTVLSGSVDVAHCDGLGLAQPAVGAQTATLDEL
jgi:hypothetical protein